MSSGKQSSTIFVGIIFCIMAGFCWGTTGVARALGPDSATSLGVVGVRVSVAAVALFIMSLFGGDFKKSGPLSSWPWPSLILAGFCLGLFTYVYLESMKLAGVALGASISCASIPVFSMLFEIIALKVKPSKGQVMGLLGCVIGGTVVSYFGSGGGANVSNPVVLKGCLLALLSGVIFAGYSMVIQRTVRQGFPYNTAISGMFFFATLIWLTYALLYQDMSWVFHKTQAGVPSGLLMGLYIGLFSAAAGYFCYVRGIARVPVSIAVSLGMAEPLTGTLLGVTLLGESLNKPTWVGMAVLFIGIYVIGQATVAKNRREKGLKEGVPQPA